jgi:peptide/nickel transport system substrate-binding protein
MRKGRFCLLGILVPLIVVASLAACVGQDQPRYGGTLVNMLNPSEVITLDPLRSSITDAETGSIIMQVHRGLVVWTPELSVEPALAESWDISEDGTVYTFHLRQGASFQNGREVIAQDCKYSFERLMDPNRGGISVYIFSNVVGADEFRNGEVESITGIEVVDDHTLRITLKSLDLSFLTTIGEPGAGVVPSEAVEAMGDGAFGRNPVGAGPFMFESWQGDTITLKDFEEYYGGRPYLDTLVFRRVSDYQAAGAAFLAQEVDSFWVSPVNYPRWKNDPNFQELKVAELWTRHLGFNNQWGPFQDKRVRQALNYAIDRDAYVRVYLNNVPISATGAGIFPPGFNIPSDVSGYYYSPEKAKELLADAGYPDGFEFSVVGDPTAATWGIPAIEPLLPYFEAIGVHCRLLPTEYGTVEMDALTGNYESYVDSHGGEPTALQFTQRFHSKNFGATNWLRYSNPEVDALIDEAILTTDDVARTELLGQIERIVTDDAPWIAINFSTVIFGTQVWVHDMQQMPIDLKYQQYEKVWVDERSPRA